MSGELQLLFGASLVWFGVFLAASLAGAALYTGFRRLAKLAPPAARGGVIMLYGMLPLLVATLVVCMLNFATLYSWLLPGHCHGDVCAPHAPEFAAPAAGAAVGAATALLGAGFMVWLAAGQLRRRLTQSRVASRLAEPAGGYRLIDSDTPAAWCDGLWFPAVYISRGLLTRVDEAELRIVLAHEHAHARRRDNLARLLLDWSTVLWPGTLRQCVRGDFATAAEQACDAEAAMLAGDKQRVSDLLSRLGPDAAIASEIDARVGERVSELQAAAEYSEGVALAPWVALLTLWLGSAFLFTLAAHPLLEWISA